MLALSEKVWHIPQFLQPEQCQQLLDLALQHGFVLAQVRAASGTRAMPMVRNNLRAQLPSPEWVSVLWQSLLAHDLPTSQGDKLVVCHAICAFTNTNLSSALKCTKTGRGWKTACAAS